MLPPGSPDDLGTSCPEDYLIESDSVMRRKIKKKSTNDSQSTGVSQERQPPKCLTLHARRLCCRSRHVCTEFLERFP